MQIKQDFIPTGSSNRPGTFLNPTYLTIHETANPSKGANANMHARYVKGADARFRKVSWHFTVDDTEIIQHLPLNEIGWHAGASGNIKSIGIELCVNRDGNFAKTKQHAQWLIQKLMNELNIPIERVVTHMYWTGKKCPANLLSTFETFKKGAIAMKSDEPSLWAKSSWEKALKARVMNQGQGPQAALTREQLAVILDRLGKL